MLEVFKIKRLDFFFKVLIQSRFLGEVEGGTLGYIVARSFLNLDPVSFQIFCSPNLLIELMGRMEWASVPELALASYSSALRK